MPTVTVGIDPGSCMGAQRCVHLAPRVFRVGEDGVAEVVDPGAASEERLVQAARECPNLAIRVWRDGVLLAGEPEETE